MAQSIPRAVYLTGRGVHTRSVAAMDPARAVLYTSAGKLRASTVGLVQHNRGLVAELNQTWVPRTQHNDACIATRHIQRAREAQRAFLADMHWSSGSAPARSFHACAASRATVEEMKQAVAGAARAQPESATAEAAAAAAPSASTATVRGREAVAAPQQSEHASIAASLQDSEVPLHAADATASSASQADFRTEELKAHINPHVEVPHAGRSHLAETAAGGDYASEHPIDRSGKVVAQATSAVGATGSANSGAGGASSNAAATHDDPGSQAAS